MRKSSYMMSQRNNSGMSGSSLGGGKKAIQGPRHTKARASADTVCQKCGARGHFLFECKNERPYVARPTRTQQLKNPKRNEELYGDKLQREREAQASAASQVLKKKEKERKRAKSASTSGSDSSSGSDSDSSSTSGSDSESDSTSGSDSESDSGSDSTAASKSKRRSGVKEGKKRARDSRSPSPPRRHRAIEDRRSRSPPPRRDEDSSK